jgi:hypothetical protein
MDPSINSETQRVLGVVSRVLSVFGGDTEPVAPGPFAAAPDLEARLGRGQF